MNTIQESINTAIEPLVSELQIALPFFGRVLGRVPVQFIRGVDIGYKKEPGYQIAAKEVGKTRRLPLLWDSDLKTNIPVLPDVSKGALLFFITTGPGRVLEPSAGWALTERSQIKTYPVALIAWWDAESVYNSTGLSPDSVQAIIERTAGRLFDWKTISADDQLTNRIFEGIDLDTETHTYLLYPFTGLRLTGELTVKETLC